MIGNISGVVSDMEENIEEICQSIFQGYAEELAGQPAARIIHSVWGVNDKSEACDNQKIIYNMLQPAVEQIINSLTIPDFDSSKRQAIEYLIRCFVTSKLLLMMTLYKAASCQKEISEHNKKNFLRDMEIAGHA